MTEKKLSAKEVIGIGVSFTILVFGVLILCGTLTSGFHFVDDGDFISIYIKNQIEGKGYWEILKEVIQRDMTLFHRLRPLYFVLRVGLGVRFGLNLYAISVIRGIEIVFAMLIIYCCARKMHFNMLHSVAITFFVMVGPQSAVWWKLGPQEAGGMWLLPLIVLCVLLYYESKDKIYNILALMISFAASLYKETFILFLPVVGCMYLILEQRKEGISGKELTIKDIIQFIRNRIGSIIYLLSVFVGILYVWLIRMGGNDLSYAKVTSEVSLYDYLLVQFNNLRMPLRVGSYALFAAVTVGCMWKYRRKILEYKLEFVLSLYMILSQMVIYIRTGLEERYVYPWILGVCLLFVILVIKMNVLEGKKKIIYYACFGILLVYNWGLLIYEANYFTHRGESISAMWEAVEDITDEETVILTAFAPYYESDQTNLLWFEANGIENIYHVKEGKYCRYGEEDITTTYEEVDIVLFYHPSDRHYIYEPKLDFSEFDITEFGTVRMAVRKGYNR